MKRLLYFGYYLKELDKEKFRKFTNYVVSNYNKSKIGLYADILISSLKYNISINEYYLFHFYKSNKELRETYAGTGFMYEYQLKMNPKSSRNVLEDKLQFLEVYKDCVFHDFASIGDLKDPGVANRILSNKSGKIVLKGSDGQCGRGIEVRNSSDFTPESLIKRLEELNNDFAEEYVMQHDKINGMSPSGLNTIRIITQLDKDSNVDILGARFRITINSSVDNLAAGNIAAPINVATGVVEGPGVYSDITKKDEEVHPVTGVSIVGFEIPYWAETIDMVKKAALTVPENKSIGWDVAITNNGPELIEGNHDWCKLLWQLPVKKGLKNVLLKYQHDLIK
ncbi:hexapeptide transferase [Flavobacterium salilacus subsp. salilacus]|uniref:sugar-transfer associated ATP-grasp domain-containing protein n=1 Tax=Flavobacterium TaxID=237 RepID=UPI001074C174|nr:MULTISPECIES: sugar-transfer associated ATP-grasp domain-containing protein [Flavobacterium]KAF2519760.1 hexapeptide transferase [Flavobacterium salilacus subsp. salilacus]MBE1614345.1 hexapeptide transferase [Flavobacterium sp. SaA2.13]